MKKLVLSIFTAILVFAANTFPNTVNAKNIASTQGSPLQTEAKVSIAKAGMATLVALTSESFKEGMSEEDFLNDVGLSRDTKVSSEFKALISDIYNYHAKGYSLCQIVENEDGASLFGLARVGEANAERTKNENDKINVIITGNTDGGTGGGGPQSKPNWKDIIRLIIAILSAIVN